jgi:hypothetical protein
MNDLMIPEKGSIPAYLLNPEHAREANAEAMAGITTGAPPRVKLAGKQFTMVDGGGVETPYPPAKLKAGPDGNLYLPLVVLRAKPAIQKSFYAGAYNPNAEATAPDCFSNDGVSPDPAAGHVQCALCANCPKNAFGSGTDQSGNATQGKACTDNKIIAVFVPNSGIHQFKIPPASLKNFGIYVKQLSASGLALGSVVTYVGFDMAATFPVLVFKFGDYVPQGSIEKLADLAQSLEAEEIVQTRIVGAKKALPAPAPAPVSAPVSAPAPVSADDLGLDTPAPPKATRGRPAKVAPAEAAAPVGQATPVASATDEEIRAELGL